MTSTARLLDIASVDTLITTCRAYSNVTDEDGTTRILTRHRFDQHGTLELRILPTYGFGGKLYVEQRAGGPRASVSAYQEDEQASWFQTERFARFKREITAVPLAWETAGDCTTERNGIIHLLTRTHDPEADFDPIRCGLGIALPGHPTHTVPTCPACRLARLVGGDKVALADEMATLLADLLARKTFPDQRRVIATKQIALLEAAASFPRWTIVQAVARGDIHRLAVNVDRPLTELYDAFFTWNTRVLAAHGVRDRASFPMRKAATDLLERCEAALGVPAV